MLACVRSLADVDAEIVVLDNASEDGSVEALRERFPRVRVIAQRFRAGYGANHNTVIRTTKSRYVLVLNADMEIPPGTVERLVGYLESNPRVAVVGPLIRDFAGRQQPSALRLMTVPRQLVWALTLGQVGAVMSRGRTPRPVGAVAVGAALFRRQALEQIGLFDEAYFMYAEESDVAKRLAKLGFERHYLPSAEVLHHGQRSTGHDPERQVNETWRSLDVYLARYHSPLEGRILRTLNGLGYALAAAAAEVPIRLPNHLKPSVVSSRNVSVYRLHARNAFRGIREPGFRELAEDWNRRHGVASARGPSPDCVQ